MAAKFLKQLDPNIIANIAAGVNNYISTPTAAPVVNEKIQSIFDTVNFLNNFSYIATIFLVLWGMSRIVIQFIPITDKQKEDAKEVNKILFGDIGVIPMIFIIWVSVVFVTTIIPILIDVSPKFSDLLTGANKFIYAAISSGVTNLVKK